MAATGFGDSGADLELDGIRKTFPGFTAIEELDLVIPAGSFFALLGPSGCGKTTTLRLVAGLEEPTAGRILIGGKDVTAVKPHKRPVNTVFQSYALFPHMSILDNVAFGLKRRKVADAVSRAHEALALVELDHVASRRPSQLSGGQQQRVALARAIVTRPRVLLLDEPLSALDAKVRVVLREQIRRIQTELGITTLFVTHDQEEALAVADRVAVMREGRIEQIGSPEDLYAAPETAFVADFVGISNRVPAVVRDGVVEAYGMRFEVLGERPADGPVSVFVRPEDVAFVSSGGMPATVLTSSFLGSFRRTSVRLDDGTLLSIQHDVGVQPAAGSVVRIEFRARPVSVVARDD